MQLARVRSEIPVTSVVRSSSWRKSYLLLTSKLRVKRHNALARCVAQHLSQEGNLDATTTAHLNSSLTSNTKQS